MGRWSRLFRPRGQPSILPRRSPCPRSPGELLRPHSLRPGASPVSPPVPWAGSSGQYWSSMYCSISVLLSGCLSSGGARRLLAAYCSHCTSTSRSSSMAVTASSTDECPCWPTCGREPTCHCPRSWGAVSRPGLWVQAQGRVLSEPRCTASFSEKDMGPSHTEDRWNASGITSHLFRLFP